MKARIGDIKAGMYLEEDIMLPNGLLLIPEGTLVSQAVARKIRSYSSLLSLEKEIDIKYAG